MSAFWPLLRDGLRLTFLRAPKKAAITLDYLPLLALVTLQSLAALPSAWIATDAPHRFDPNGLISLLASLAVSVLAAAAMARLVQRRALVLSIAAWLIAAGIVPWLLYSALVWHDPSWSAALLYGLFGLCWYLAICTRLALFLAPDIGRAFAGAAAALLIGTLPWMAMDAPSFIQTDWAAYYEEEWEDGGEEGERIHATSELAAPEATFYAQTPLLDAALDALAPQRPGHIDMYVLGFGGDADEGAFRNEVDFLPALAANRLDAQDRALRLVNHTDSADSVPLATVTNLERALTGIGERMDAREDILFLYLTSHGSENHSLYVNQPPLPLRQLTPATLRKALDAAGIRWRVIVVSACYSGGYVDALSDPRTLVVTAARADRTSFGCGNSADATWFGQAFLIDGLNHTANFRRAFLRARKQVAQREEAEDYTASEPQWRAGEAISEHLARWRETLPPGQSVAFVPSVRVSHEAGPTMSADASDESE
ncbi:caspase family protein [Xanthomonadaceae bacterium JHOS43]|nr:caspase family protein [Xanthomonadaceae bacterium JHOS43]MCX7563834.1 caspase family protein [Xanthomonadaceae bacterium XH05]